MFFEVVSQSEPNIKFNGFFHYFILEVYADFSTQLCEMQFVIYVILYIPRYKILNTLTDWRFKLQKNVYFELDDCVVDIVRGSILHKKIQLLQHSHHHFYSKVTVPVCLSTDQRKTGCFWGVFLASSHPHIILGELNSVLKCWKMKHISIPIDREGFSCFAT